MIFNAFGNTKAECFDKYRAGEINKTELMTCGNIKDIPVPEIKASPKIKHVEKNIKQKPIKEQSKSNINSRLKEANRRKDEIQGFHFTEPFKRDQKVKQTQKKKPREVQKVTYSVASSDEIVYNSPWDGGVRQVENYLKKTLRDPDSYQSITWYQVMKRSDGYFVVRHRYRAKNGFGGYQVVEQRFTLSNNGNVVKVE